MSTNSMKGQLPTPPRNKVAGFEVPLETSLEGCSSGIWNQVLAFTQAYFRFGGFGVWKQLNRMNHDSDTCSKDLEIARPSGKEDERTQTPASAR